MIINGAFPKLIGSNLIDLKDAEGRYFVREMISKGKSGKGTVEYRWKDKTGKIETKISYLVKVKDLVLGCGCYK
jgi:signal transduction histidine kinase